MCGQMVAGICVRGSAAWIFVVLCHLLRRVAKQYQSGSPQTPSSSGSSSWPLTRLANGTRAVKLGEVDMRRQRSQDTPKSLESGNSAGANNGTRTDHRVLFINPSKSSATRSPEQRYHLPTPSAQTSATTRGYVPLKHELCRIAHCWVTPISRATNEGLTEPAKMCQDIVTRNAG